MDDSNAIFLYLGGRGSSLLGWISNDAKTIQDFLCSAFRRGLTLEKPGHEHTQIHIRGPITDWSPNLLPKVEVARGLLAGPLPRGGVSLDAQSWQTALLGESWVSDAQTGQGIPWDARLTADQFRTLHFPQNLDSSYIATFLTSVLNRNLNTYNLDSKLNSLIQISPELVQHHLQLSLQQDILQPLFVYELQAVIDKYMGDVIR